MPDSVNLHPCVDILIGTNHQAYYRLLIFVCPVTPWIASLVALMDTYFAYGGNQRIPALCVILPNGGIGKSYTGARVISVFCHHGLICI